MQIREKKYNYLDPNQQFQFREKLANWVQVNTYVVLESEKFLEYQKDLIQDFLADLMEKINTEVYDEWDLKKNLENCLQNLNVKLKLFADKVTDVERFPIKWYIQIIAWDSIISSMIWDISILIFRDWKIYYQLHNWVNKKTKIDLFSDFIEWNIETWDEILYVWTKVTDVLDQWDIKELETVIDQEETSFVEIFEKTLLSRVEKEKLWLISNYYIHWNIVSSVESNSPIKKWWNRMKWKFNWWKAWLRRLADNKYYVIIWVLWIIVLILLYSVLSALLDTKNSNTIVTESWTVIDITIDDIKKDIRDFQQMDPSSNEKSIKYNEIVEKLTLLEQNWRWLEDVENLKWIVENDYYKWFNIIRIENLSQLDDLASWIKTRQISFNSSEKWKMWEVLFIDYQKSINVWWTKWALIWSVNDWSRWSLIEYWVDTNMAWCSENLLKDWLYCYISDGRVYNITKAWIEPVTTQDWVWFPDTVWGLWVYLKNNFYVFQPNLNSALNWVVLTRYRNTAWSETVYQPWQNYTIAEWYDENIQFVWNFAWMTIDGDFLIRNDGKLYHFWRPTSVWSTLEVREVKLLWWDSITNKYSNDVKIIASTTTKYVYLFDRVNKTFTVYTSNPLKTNDANRTTYNLKYLFSFKFALTSEEVKDICIPDATWNNPEMYILTSEWVNKVNLYEYIKSVEKDDTLKAVNSAE